MTCCWRDDQHQIAQVRKGAQEHKWQYALFTKNKDQKGRQRTQVLDGQVNGQNQNQDRTGKDTELETTREDNPTGDTDTTHRSRRQEVPPSRRLFVEMEM
ncbi:hypothetical protein EYF80_055689 [Liparis tanakae]|uniref:Uncharacterized protein n=1 Tax=Liparis tanakae TaxID=230148 RepID=A0A4Z2EZU6_9TELE|nr:hypothetical protein EYF80_055689 [Liparis tanakae]